MTAQESLKTAQEAPKTAQDGPKTVPRQPQDAPRWPQDGPRTPLKIAIFIPKRPDSLQYRFFKDFNRFLVICWWIWDPFGVDFWSFFDGFWGRFFMDF